MSHDGFPQIEFKAARKTGAHWAAMASLACATLFVVLVLLAMMQYRWLAELREAERNQLEASLRATADRFADDFASELLRVVTAFQLDYRSPSESLAHQLKDAYEQWVGSAPHPTLIREVLIVKAEGAGLGVYRFDVKSETLKAIDWLAGLDPLKQTPDHPQPSAPLKGNSMKSSPVFLEAIPALAVPFMVTELPAPGHGRKANPPRQRDIPGWSVARLDRDLIVEELLPTLFESHFGGASPPPYRIAVASAERPHRIVYESGSMSDEDLNSADLVLDLIKEAGGQLMTGGPQNVRILAPESPQWQLFIKHRLGSLDAAAENLRRRNLAIGVGILLLLVGSVVLILVSANRARTLGRLQVEFAAAVSHELRTPLAVIQAAAYNLVEGVIEDASQVRHYAGLIRDSGRRLSKMVDQILLLAETQSWRRNVPMYPVAISDLVDRTLDNLSVMSNGGLPVFKDIRPGLPLVAADPLLLSHCVQNLISNGLKYGEVSDQKPLKISAAAHVEKKEVQIRVADQGPGINQVDLPHIFKPFYRGKQAHLDPSGNGLGLALVQRLMERQLGAVTVQTGPYGGTAFILHIPIAT